MYTQCSKCETVFRLSAEVLRAAGGQVRCGRCGDVFNALARLAEDADAFPKGESPLELEARADAILESVQPVSPADTATEVDAPPDGELAQLRIIGAVDDDLASEASLEFTLPPGELDRIFVETAPSPLQILAASLKAFPPAPPAAPSASPPPPTPSPTPPPPAAIPEPAPAPRARLDVSEAAIQEMLRSAAPGVTAAHKPRLGFAAWAVAAAVLLVLLALQVMRKNADWFAVRSPGGDASAATVLEAYQLRQWGVTGDPGANGTLRVRASIMNSSAQLQPFPLLRVTLADRFGTRVGQREFGAAEYLGGATARKMTPGERVDATLDIQDPGKDAEGFEIDLCIRGADKKIVCAGEGTASPAPAK